MDRFGKLQLKFKLLLLAFVLLMAGILLVLGYALYLGWFVERKDPLREAPKGTRYVQVGEDHLAFREIRRPKAKVTVVFVGGLAAWHGTWWPRVEALAARQKHWNFAALDLPPFGYSLISDQGNYSRAQQAQRILGFLEHLKGQKIILVAHSYGAGPATEAVMLAKPHRVQRLVLIDGVLNVDEKRPDSRSFLDIGPLRDLGVGLAIHNRPFSTERIKGFVYRPDRLEKPVFDRYFQPFDNQRTGKKYSRWVADYTHDRLGGPSTQSAHYRRLKIPVRILWGREDTLTPLDLTKVLLENLPKAKLEVLNQVGHIPMVEDVPLFDAALVRAVRH
ncbi:MAG: alpha/beta hydrolase [Candidatus Eremiobacteraeota bacterium]|nr:alpha/beta hydrolase [Candidatus Eremiobacteraeota bacterium]